MPAPARRARPKTAPKTGAPTTAPKNRSPKNPPLVRSPVWRYTKLAFLGVLVFLVGLGLYFTILVYRLRSHDPETSSFRELREGQGVVTQGASFVPLSEIHPNLV